MDVYLPSVRTAAVQGAYHASQVDAKPDVKRLCPTATYAKIKRINIYDINLF